LGNQDGGSFVSSGEHLPCEPPAITQLDLLGVTWRICHGNPGSPVIGLVGYPGAPWRTRHVESGCPAAGLGCVVSHVLGHQLAVEGYPWRSHVPPGRPHGWMRRLMVCQLPFQFMPFGPDGGNSCRTEWNSSLARREHVSSRLSGALSQDLDFDHVG